MLWVSWASFTLNALLRDRRLLSETKTERVQILKWWSNAHIYLMKIYLCSQLLVETPTRCCFVSVCQHHSLLKIKVPQMPKKNYFGFSKITCCVHEKLKEPSHKVPHLGFFEWSYERAAFGSRKRYLSLKNLLKYHKGSSPVEGFLLIPLQNWFSKWPSMGSSNKSGLQEFTPNEGFFQEVWWTLKRFFRLTNGSPKRPFSRTPNHPHFCIHT